MRTRTSFQKRQKEIARAEKQRDKQAKRQQKKLIGKQPLDTDEAEAADGTGTPEVTDTNGTPGAPSGMADS